MRALFFKLAFIFINKPNSKQKNNGPWALLLLDVSFLLLFYNPTNLLLSKRIWNIGCSGMTMMMPSKELIKKEPLTASNSKLCFLFFKERFCFLYWVNRWHRKFTREKFFKQNKKIICVFQHSEWEIQDCKKNKVSSISLLISIVR